MREQCRLHRLTSATAGSFGYGGNANEAAEDASFEGYVASVGAAQAANQNVVQTLIQRNNVQASAITQMQQQLAQMVAVGVQAAAVPPVQYQQQQYPRQNNCNNRNGQGGGRGNGRGGGGRGAGRGGGRGGWTGYQQPGAGWTGNQRQGGQSGPNARLGHRPPNVNRGTLWDSVSD